MTEITNTGALQRLMDRQELTDNQMHTIMRRIMQGQLSEPMMAALLIALRAKQETIGEITAAAQVMREFSMQVNIPNKEHLLDIVGTGGDAQQTFNISTCSMFVAAAAGARVCKHGGRSVSSQSGSADVLEALGASLMLSPEQINACLEQTGLGFMFAPNHHPAMKSVAPVRKALGVRTIFNILGPLTNPAGAPHILMGVFSPELVGIQVRVMQKLGAKRALVVHGYDGLDEASLSGPTWVAELKDGLITEYTITPQELGLPLSRLDALKVSNPEQSSAMLKGVLSNKGGPAQDIVILNAALAIYVSGVALTVVEGLQKAREALQSGRAHQLCQNFIQCTRAMGAVV